MSKLKSLKHLINAQNLDLTPQLLPSPLNSQMANQNSDWGFSDLWSSVKSQSITLANDCQKDLKELAATVADDTSAAVNSLRTEFDKVRNDLNETSSIGNSKEELEQKETGEENESTILNSWVRQAEEMASSVGENLYQAFQKVNEVGHEQINSAYTLFSYQDNIESKENLKFMLSNPRDDENLTGKFDEFLRDFNFTEKSGEISQIFQHNSDIRGLHNDLVPDQITNEEFWTRYCFHRFILSDTMEDDK